MDPIVTILRWGHMERPIGAYGMMLAIGILAGTVMATRAAHRDGMDAGSVIAATGFTVAGGILGSVVLSVLVEWAISGSLSDSIAQPGFVFYGAPIGGGLAAIWSSRKLELPTGRLLDLIAPAIPIAHAFGRLGCFLGGCCYGAPFEGAWAVKYTHPIAPASLTGLSHHPSQLYESAALIVLAAALLLVPLKRVGSGYRILAYLMGYAVIRFSLEFLRGDPERGVFLGASTSQMIAVVIFIAAVIAWRRVASREQQGQPS